LDAFNDVAVWAVPPVVDPTQWQMVEIPALPRADFAFVIDGGPVAESDEDWVDAPDDQSTYFYPTLLANNGARHFIAGPSFAGTLPVDGEFDGQPDANAVGDDFNDGNDDEDGVWFPISPPAVRGVADAVEINVDGGGGVVQIWVDWDADGSWDPVGEMVYSNYLADGQYFEPLDPPPDAVPGQIFARARISTAGDLPTDGWAPDGEVEDHSFTVLDGAMEWARLDSPPMTVTTVAMPTELIYGQCYHVDFTTGSGGPNPLIIAEVGYGPDGNDPTVTEGDWMWFGADYVGDGDNDNNDQYAGTLTVPVPGRYDYCFRFSLNGLDWTYADLDGNPEGYEVEQAGDLFCEPCPKWVQEPDCEHGVDLPSYVLVSDQSVTSTWFRVADDWLCDGRPITHIRWWGSYPGWPDPTPPLDDVLGRPVSFRLTWYTDLPVGDPENPEDYSQPKDRLLTVEIPLAMYGYSVPGMVREEYYCEVPKPNNDPPVEFEYQYDVELPEPWNEKEGRIYWLSIEAVYASTYVPHPTDPMLGPEWGWKTSALTNIIDDAVVWRAEGGPPPPYWEELHWPVPGYPWDHMFVPPVPTLIIYEDFISAPPEMPSVNMAFELLTDVCPRRDTKWSQMPDMETGEDLWSWTTWDEEQRSPYLRADDFISDGRLITDIHWWGSYSNWMTWVDDASETNPVAPPSTPFVQQPWGFCLSWHTNAGCVPGDTLALVYVSITNCHEMYYGTVVHDWPEQEVEYEHEYQYYVDLMATDDGPQPWAEMTNGHYWLNIEAIFDNDFVPGGYEQDGHYGWGWKIAVTNSEVGIECEPAVFDRATGGWEIDTGSLSPNNPRLGDPSTARYDMSFELTTIDVGGGKIVITNMIATGSSTTHTVKSVGTSGAGTQYLQMNTNLLTNVWTDIPGQTKVAPFPPPIVNTWTVTGVTDSNVFYRVNEK
jgi:hypothetical protein